MGVKVNFSVFGKKQIDLTLDRFNLNDRDMMPLWLSLRRSFVYYMRRQFASQGGEFGKVWPGVISDRYRALKSLYYPGKPTLEASGRLKDSLTKEPLLFQRYTQRSVELGTNVFYGRIHHRGVSRNTKMAFKIGDEWVHIRGLPERQIIGMNASMRTSWRKKIQRFLVRGQTVKGEER